MANKRALDPNPAEKFFPPLVWFSFLFLAVYLLYLRTLCPAFMDDDSPETIAAGVALGLQHPPSYALDTLFVRLASFLPLGGMAFRINVASALLAALAVVLFARNILWALGHFLSAPSRKTSFPLPLLCSIAGAFLLAFSRTYWEKALGAKGGIYLLQALLIQGLLHCFLRHTQEGDGSRSRRWLDLAFFIFSMGFTNHWQTQAVFLPLMLLFFLKTDPSKGAWTLPSIKVLLVLFTFSLLSLSPLLFLPLRSHLHPAWNLGAPDHFQLFVKSLRRGYVDERETGLMGMFFHILGGRAQWEDLFHLARRILDLQGPALGAHLVRDLTWPALVLALLGVRAPWNQAGRKVLLSLLLPFAFLLLIFFTSIWVPTNVPFGWLLDNYLLPANWMAAFLAAVGLYYLLGVLPPLGRTLGLTAALLSLLWPLCANFPGLDLERQTLRYDYGANLLKSTPAGAVLFGEGDEDDFTAYYFQAVEGRRPDVRLIPAFTLFEPWGVVQVERLHPELGLTASSRSFPDPIARLVYAASEIVVKNHGRSVCGFSYFDGAFERYYLGFHSSIPLRRSGVLLELDSPLAESSPPLPLSALRLRNLYEASNSHDSLKGILILYRNLGLWRP